MPRVRVETIDQPRSPSLDHLLYGVVNFPEALYEGTTDEEFFVTHGDILDGILNNAEIELADLLERGIKVKGDHKRLQLAIMGDQIKLEHGLIDLTTELVSQIRQNYERGTELFPSDLKESFLSSFKRLLGDYELSFSNQMSRAEHAIFKHEDKERMSSRELKETQNGFSVYDNVLPLAQAYGQHFQDLIDALEIDLRAQKVMQGQSVDFEDDGDPAFEIPDFVRGGPKQGGPNIPSRRSHLQVVKNVPQEPQAAPAPEPPGRA